MNSTFQAYNDIEVSTDVLGASNHRLIQMLFEKCIQHMQATKPHIQNKDIRKKHQTLTKALDILGYLRGCLNFDDINSREIANQLDVLYDFLERHLLKANIHNEIEYIDQAQQVLAIIKSGWDSIG